MTGRHGIQCQQQERREAEGKGARQHAHARSNGVDEMNSENNGKIKESMDMISFFSWVESSQVLLMSTSSGIVKEKNVKM